MEQRFGRRGLSIDPMGRFPGEISPARERYIYIEEDKLGGSWMAEG